MSSTPYYRYRREIMSNFDISMRALRSLCDKRGWKVSVSSFDENMGFTITIEGKTKAPRMAVLPYLGGSFSSGHHFRFAFWEYETEKRGKSLVITMDFTDKERLPSIEEDLLDTFRMASMNHPFFIDYCREEKPFVAHTREELVWKALTAPARVSSLEDRLRRIAYGYYLSLVGRTSDIDINKTFPSLY